MGRSSSLILLAALGLAVYLPRESRPRPAQAGPVRRIVSLIPSHTEIVYEAGAGDLLVGVSRACDHPPEARLVPKIGDVLVDYESVYALQPDLVISSEMMMARPNASLHALGLRVLAVDPASWEEIAEFLRTVGRLTERVEPAERAAERMMRRVREIRPGSGRVVFVEPSPRVLWAAGGGSVPDLAIRAAGGTNAFAHLPASGWVDWETLLRTDPDVIVIPAGSRETLEMHAGIRARILEIDEDSIVRPTPRLVDAAERLAEFLR